MDVQERVRQLLRSHMADLMGLPGLPGPTAPVPPGGCWRNLNPAPGDAPPPPRGDDDVTDDDDVTRDYGVYLAGIELMLILPIVLGNTLIVLSVIRFPRLRVSRTHTILINKYV